jgi:hypothetical protein
MQTETSGVAHRFQGREPQLDIAPTAGGTFPQVDAFMWVLKLAFLMMCLCAVFGMAGRYLEVSALDYVAYSSAGLGASALLLAGAIIALGCWRRDRRRDHDAKAVSGLRH